MLLKIIDRINGLDRKHKWAIMMITDSILVLLSLYYAYALRYGKAFPVDQLTAAWPLFPTLVFFGLVYSWVLSIPKIKLQSFSLQSIQRIALCSLLLVLTAMSMSFLLRFSAPRSVPLIFGILYFSGALFSRANGQILLRQLYLFGRKRTNVLIYGAGEAGIQLVSSLQQSKEVKVVAFVDDNKLQQKLIIFGLPVHGPKNLETLVKEKKIERILIAIPSLSQSDQKEIAKTLQHLPCAIQIMPSQVDIIQGSNILDSFISVKPEDLLGRDKFDVDLPDVDKPYRGKSILISGAGGSIGLELCRQILKLEPRKLVIFDHSEHNLYQAEKELRPVANTLNIPLVPVLGSVTDEKKVARIFEDEEIEAVFHAAAYKHVPLVEANEIAGVKNNVLGTHVLAAQALKSKIETFVLISTDKAVRPTNIMGATKRLAELVIQDCDQRSKGTKFSMVRFGNVLGSSGSVIPLFKDQIAKGGPVTLTHNEVTRYFMAISEAATLVIIAGSFAQGGDVFVLDMGSPVKIKDLARRMIEKSGLAVRDDDNPSGDIEIKVTGLRPGEKLYEELLIDAKTLSTPHPKIMRAQESYLPSQKIKSLLKQLKSAIDEQDNIQARELIRAWVDGYHQPGEKT